VADRTAEAGASVRSVVLGRHWPELLAVLVLIASWIAMRGIPVGNDVVWELWIARQMLGGTQLYSQIVEVNPPLWYWMAMPVQWAAEMTGIAATRLMVGAVFAYNGLATALLALLVRSEAQRDRAVLLLAMLAMTVVVPLAAFAQREHLCLIAAIPYLALTARRAEGRAVPWPLALAIGLLAAPAFALKHYFLLGPLALEGWLAWERRGAWRPIRPETSMLLAAALAYAVAVLLLTPEYLTVMVPMLAAAYLDYGVSFTRFLREPFVWVWAASAIVLVFYRGRATALTRAAVVAAIAFALTFVWQHKWWDYHALPLMGTLGMAIATLLVGRQAWSTAGRVGSIAVLAATALAPVIAVVQGPYVNLARPYIDRLLHDAQRGDSVMILTAFGTRTWPMMDEGGFVWPSRYFGLWQWSAVAAAQASAGGLTPQLAQIAADVTAATVEDLECNPPAIAIVDETDVEPGGRAIDFLDESPAFRTLFGSYMRVGSDGVFTAYRRVAPLPPPADPAACRVIH
jgi:hypothetical protein